MLISHNREKLINAILYFAHNTKFCGKIKIVKLLYLLDFEHYRQTGRSVTDQDYQAWKMGPVPVDFFQEWDFLGSDLAESIEIVPEKVIDYVRETVVPRRDFDDTHFTKRELRIMGSLVDRFRDDFSQPMVHVTHQEKGPWAAIWDQGRGKHQRIPYYLAITAEGKERDELLYAADEYEGIRAAAKISN